VVPKPTRQPNPEKIDAFAHRMIGIIDDGALAVMTSIGHRTGLLDAMAERSPCTLEEIAAATGLSEEYVGGWLDAMVRGGIVSRDSASGAYALPPEHAASLSRGGASDNLAELAEYVSLLGAAEDRIVESFQGGGDVPFDSRPSFHEVLESGSDRAVSSALADSILPLVPGLLEALRSGIDILDIGCGSGRTVNLMASIFPRSRFFGYDASSTAIDHAGWGAFERGLSNAHFQVCDPGSLDEPSRFHLITDFDGLHAQERARDVLGRIARGLRPGGVFLMQESAASSRADESPGDRIGPAVLSAASLERKATSTPALRESIAALCGEEQTRQLLLEVGFAEVKVHHLPHHVLNSFFIATRGSGDVA
jgi:SAM-dependent methyltransferase